MLDPLLLSQPPGSPDDILDARGLLCPLPVIRAADRLRGKPRGFLLRVEATDSGVIEDFPLWCASTGNQFVGYEEVGKVLVCWLKKTSDWPK